MKIKVLHKNVSYSMEEYTIEIRNKIDRYILLSDDIGGDQITLNLGNQFRRALNTTNNSIFIYPGQTKTVKLLFTKYFDDGVIPEEINFKNVRILSKLSSDITNEDILKSYSFNVKIK